MPFEVTVLGCSSALPTSNRHPSAQLVNLLGRFFLLDCGEGTQMQLRKYKIKIQKINFICISHLHGDHYLGLMGLLSTMSLLNRKKELVIFCPKGLKNIIDIHLKYSYTNLVYPLKIIELGGKGLVQVFEDDYCKLFSFPLKHRIPCFGFKLVEKKKSRKILSNVIEKYNIPFSAISGIKLGDDYILDDGTVLKNNTITIDSHIPRKYVYCSDTKKCDNLIDFIRCADLLYHESTFHSDLSHMAKSTYHSTSKDAAVVASEACVKKLIIGHFSSRYKDLNLLKEDAKKYFNNVDIAIEGKTWKIKKEYNHENNSR